MIHRSLLIFSLSALARAWTNSSLRVRTLAMARTDTLFGLSGSSRAHFKRRSRR